MFKIVAAPEEKQVAGVDVTLTYVGARHDA